MAHTTSSDAHEFGANQTDRAIACQHFAHGGVGHAFHWGEHASGGKGEARQSPFSVARFSGELRANRQKITNFPQFNVRTALRPTGVLPPTVIRLGHLRVPTPQRSQFASHPSNLPCLQGLEPWHNGSRLAQHDRDWHN